jgi:flavin-dependent dehydrogenase
MWGISRAVFDSVLLEAAMEAGVEVWQPGRVEGHGQDARGTNWMRVRHPENNSVQTIESDVVIVADGKGTVVGARPGQSGDFGIKAHFELRDGARDVVQLFGVDACYAGVAPIEGGLFNIACSVPRERIERCRDVAAVFEEMIGENRGLEEVMRGAKRVSQWMAAPLPRCGVRRDWPVGVIPIGNAAAALEPIGGEGRGLALRSAEMAAQALTTDSDLCRVQERLQREFAELWRWRSMIWRGVAMMVSRPVLCELAVDVMNVTNAGERLVSMAKGMGVINESGSLQ